MKLGKKAATPSTKDLHLSNYAQKEALPVPPSRFGFGTIYGDWGMLGNDRWGDCVFAGAAHETMLWNKVRHGVDVVFTAEEVLADYGAVTGFDPSDPSSDQGTNVRDALSYRRRKGVVATDGKRHKIAAYAALNPKDWDQLVLCSYLFGAVGIGFEFPSTAWAEFDKKVPWAKVDPNAQIEGGHYVCIVGSRSSQGRVTCVTWGQRQEMTKAFYEAYNDEAWVLLSDEMIRTDGTGLHGFSWDDFLADYSKVTA